MNTKNIPPLITLTAGLIAVVSMYISHYELPTLLWIVVLVLIGFYGVGLLIKKMLDTFGMQIEKEEQEKQEASEAETKLAEGQDGAVIEKQ